MNFDRYLLYLVFGCQQHLLRYLLFHLLLLAGIATIANSLQAQNKPPTPNQDSIYAHQYLQIAHQEAKQSAATTSNQCAVEAADYFLQWGNWTEYYNCYRLITSNALRFQKQAEASNLFQVAIQDLQSIQHPEAQQTIGLLYHLQSAVYHNQGRYQKAIVFGTKAIDILEQFDNPPHLARVYYNLAVASQAESVDFDKTIRYAQRALQIQLASSKIDSNRVSKLFALMSRAYRGKHEYKTAIEALQNSKAYQNQWNSQYDYLLSMIHLDKGDCDEALKILSKSLQSLTKESEEDSEIYLRLAEVWSCKKNPEQALSYYQKALQLSQKQYGVKDPDHIKIHIYLGDFHKNQGNLNDALTAYQTALKLLEASFQPSDLTDNPKVAKAYTSIWTVEAIRNKATTFEEKFAIDSNQNHLQSALKSYELVLENIEFRRNQYTDDESKHYIVNYIYAAYENAIGVSLQLYQLTGDFSYLQNAFNYIESSKASVLKEAVQERVLGEIKTIPSPLLQTLEEVKINLAQTEKQLYDLQQLLPIDSATLIDLQSHLFSLNRKKEQTLLQLASYPAYTKIKYEQIPPQINDLQKVLSSKQAMIEYFVGAKYFYTCLITQDTLVMKQHLKPPNFDTSIKNLRQALTSWSYVTDSTQKAAQEYVELSLQLYQKLLAQPLSHLTEDQQQLIIVPDGSLGYLPFEILLSEKPTNLFEFQHYPYLIRQYDISYAYASDLWIEQERKKNNTKNTYSFGGFAPIYPTIFGSQVKDSLQYGRENTSLMAFNTRGQLEDLIHAREAVNKLAVLLGGQKWLAEAATKENFQKTAANYGVLHLAMHGIVDDRNPLYSHLVFTETDGQKDNRLTAAELYTMQLNAGLAVLSACNTGVGELKRGEGIMSLSRAFAAAGCPSMVMSLWNVPDEQTGILMENFYHELKQGATKDAALRQAKLKYMNAQDNRGSHPYLWAGFVVIGDTGTIQFNEGWADWRWKLFGLIFLLLTLVSVFYFKQNGMKFSR